MNIPAALEQVFSRVLREFSELGEGVQMRPWQVLAVDGTVNDDGLRKFPLIDIRGTPPSLDDNQHTSHCLVVFIPCTQDGDDSGHVVISGLYDAVQTTLDRLFSQWMNFEEDQPDAAHPEYTAFLTALAELLPKAKVGYDFTFSGFSFGDGRTPRNENGVNMIGTTLIVHYGRSDF